MTVLRELQEARSSFARENLYEVRFTGVYDH